MTATEYIILVDECDQEIGTAEKLSAHAQNLLHRAFSVFIFRQNHEFELLLQQRAEDKYHSGGLWTNTCCSHPRQGEGIVSAGKRRLHEEFGFHAELKNMGKFHYNAHFSNGLAENEIDHVLVGLIDNKMTINPDPKEISSYRWVTMNDLERELRDNPEHFTPWFQQALDIAKKYLH